MSFQELDRVKKSQPKGLVVSITIFKINMKYIYIYTGLEIDGSKEPGAPRKHVRLPDFIWSEPTGPLLLKIIINLGYIFTILKSSGYLFKYFILNSPPSPPVDVTKRQILIEGIFLRSEKCPSAPPPPTLNNILAVG